MNREEFDKIIESNPEAKFKVINTRANHYDLGQIITFKEYWRDGAWFWDECKDVMQVLIFGQFELIAEPVVQPMKLKFPCCIATPEIKDEETFEKVRELFVASGAWKAEDGFVWGIPDFNYYGVDCNDGTKFWDNISTYSDKQKESDVTVYTLKDLFPEVTGEVIADSHPWIEWCGEGDIPDLGGNFELKLRDGDVEICKNDVASTWRWEHYNDRDIVAYRLHKDTSVASQDSAQEVLAESSTLGMGVLETSLTTPYEPFKVVKHTYYDVTIKGEEYRFTKEEANLLCTLLVEAIGEDYEPI